MKKFNHDLVTPIEIEQVTTNEGRYYVLPDGVTKLRSVTTILNEKLDKSALHDWRKRVGEQEANRVSARATSRGTAIHGIAERYLLNEDDYYKQVREQLRASFLPIQTVLDEHVDNVRGIELPLHSTLLKCAGKTDLVAEYDGIMSIIDFKTSSKQKMESWIEGYFLQSTVYAMMFESMYGIKVPQIVIIITVEDEKNAQVFVKNRGHYVNRVLEIFTK